MSKLQKLSGYVGMLALTIFGYAGYSQAAADTDLAAAIASTTGVITDNKTQIIGFIAAIVVALLLVGLAKGALMWGKRSILSIWGGRKKRR